MYRPLERRRVVYSEHPSRQLLRPVGFIYVFSMVCTIVCTTVSRVCTGVCRLPICFFRFFTFYCRSNSFVGSCVVGHVSARHLSPRVFGFFTLHPLYGIYVTAEHTCFTYEGCFLNYGVNRIYIVYHMNLFHCKAWLTTNIGYRYPIFVVSQALQWKGFMW